MQRVCLFCRMPITMCVTVNCVWYHEILSSWHIHMLSSWHIHMLSLSDLEGLLYAVSCVCVRELCVCSWHIELCVCSWHIEFVRCRVREMLKLIRVSASCVMCRELSVCSWHIEFVPRRVRDMLKWFRVSCFLCRMITMCVTVSGEWVRDVSLPPFAFHSLSHTTHTHTLSLSLSLSLFLSLLLSISHTFSQTPHTHTHTAPSEFIYSIYIFYSRRALLDELLLAEIAHILHHLNSYILFAYSILGEPSRIDFFWRQLPTSSTIWIHIFFPHILF